MMEYNWVRSQRCVCVVTWFRYHMRANLGNKTDPTSMTWPNLSTNPVNTLRTTTSLQPFWLTSFMLKSYQKSFITNLVTKTLMIMLPGLGLLMAKHSGGWAPMASANTVKTKFWSCIVIQDKRFAYEIDNLSDYDVMTFLTRQIYNWQPNNVSGSLPREQSSWGQRGAHLGPVGPRWAQCWPHKPCYQGLQLSDNVMRLYSK